MLFRKTNVRRRFNAEEITPERVECAFLGGAALHDREFETEDAARAFWLKHRGPITKWWIEGNVPDALAEHLSDYERQPDPGGRPAFWWRFDPDVPKERRRRLLTVVEMVPRPGTVYHDFVERAPTAADVANAWRCTRPGEGRFGLPISGDGYPGKFESSADFLRRHGLLSSEEKAALAKKETAR